jgi:TonB family protein
VRDLRLTRSTGHAELDQAAMDAFRKYKFVPGQEGYTVHNFEFDLTGPAEAANGRLRATWNGK